MIKGHFVTLGDKDLWDILINSTEEFRVKENNQFRDASGLITVDLIGSLSKDTTKLIKTLGFEVKSIFESKSFVRKDFIREADFGSTELWFIRISLFDNLDLIFKAVEHIHKHMSDEVLVNFNTDDFNMLLNTVIAASKEEF